METHQQLTLVFDWEGGSSRVEVEMIVKLPTGGM
jgi:hypothetical protein